jgi:hypothetical protein
MRRGKKKYRLYNLEVSNKMKTEYKNNLRILNYLFYILTKSGLILKAVDIFRRIPYIKIGFQYQKSNVEITLINFQS